jgi:hypothetical protein
MGQFFHIFSNNETFPAPANSPMAQLNELIAKWRDPLDAFWDKLQVARQAAEVPSIAQVCAGFFFFFFFFFFFLIYKNYI